MKTKPAVIIRGAVCGLFAGLLNGLLGAGGGMVIVPLLERNGQEPRKAHATSIAVITPLCVLSAAFYLHGGSVRLSDVLPFLPAGLAGAFLGAKLLPKIPDNLLRRIFGAFMLYAAWRLLAR
ncbi:MAG: sulfite exporter TauE/SafE family protein [Clostridia bacterium]|nr:sulfite exporter TauE/SafE family protein [Clostridia bacterium]MDR3644880.1 sulfite exporter TauE/SafE family protein [Clostridia bacterium]